MKSSYELAMERLSKSAPLTKVTAKQKAQIAELNSVYEARIAAREIALKSEIHRAETQGDREAADKVRQQLTAERQKLEAELEAKKEQLRNRG